MPEDKEISLKDESGDKEFFTIVPNIVLNHSTVYEQALYLTIRRISGEKGSCWLTIENLAKKAKMSESQLRISLKYLIKRNWIEKTGLRVVESGQKVNEYKINNIWHENSDFYRNRKRGVPETPLSIRQRGVPETSQRGVPETPNIISIDNNKIYRKEKSSIAESESEKDNVQKIFQTYISKILPGSRLTTKSKTKIKSRLEEFSLEDILKGIDNFSKDSWWMEHNAFRGITWFFYSEDRTELFKNLVPRKKPGEEKETLRK